VNWKIKVEKKNFEWDGSNPHYEASNDYDNSVSPERTPEKARIKLNNWLLEQYGGNTPEDKIIGRINVAISLLEKIYYGYTTKNT